MNMAVKTLTIASISLGLSTVFLVTPAQASVSAKNSHSAGTVDSSAPLNYSSFDQCATKEFKPAKTTKLGSNLGKGISEVVTPDRLAVINQSLKESGKKEFPSGTVALRLMDNGNIIALDSRGTTLALMTSASFSATSPAVKGQEGNSGVALVTANGVAHEAARIIRACIGIGGSGGVSLEMLARELFTVEKAAKFVIRRLGVFGAVSCAGGVIWEYTKNI